LGDEINKIIAQAKTLIRQQKYAECEALVCTAMFQHPHDPVPHNLMGLLLEHRRLHTDAMKHFRAAYALDPTYPPAQWNMECFAGMYKRQTEAYFPCDCSKERNSNTGNREGCSCT
jgi:Flp pilus assembly protein TadD